MIYSVYASARWVSDHACVHDALAAAKLVACRERSVQVRDGDIVLAVFGKGFSAIASRRAAQKNNDNLRKKKMEGGQ